jgi:galactokinase
MSKAAELDTGAVSLEDLCEQTAGEFRQRWSREPQYVVAAPGRVNLIGEHTDYNGGFVLPMAIERYVVIAAGPAGPGHERARVLSTNVGKEADILVSGQIAPGPVTWSSYVQGVVAGFVKRGLKPQPFDAVIRSTVPLGGGLSSSAALEVATATLLEAMLGHQLEPVQKALLCQEAEHKYANVPCGIMDQFSSTLCQKDRPGRWSSAARRGRRDRSG